MFLINSLKYHACFHIHNNKIHICINVALGNVHRSMVPELGLYLQPKNKYGAIWRGGVQGGIL